MFASSPSAIGTRVIETTGGAKLLRKIVEAAQPGVSALGLEVDSAKQWPDHLKAYAVYTASEAGFKADPPQQPGDEPRRVWRVKQAFGYGFDSTIPPAEPPAKICPVGQSQPPVLLIDDGGAGFRTNRARDRWPNNGEDGPLPPWIVLKMSQPSCEGDLWRHLVAACAKQKTSQLVVVISADELRRDGAAINRGLSWERTVYDTFQTLSTHPMLSGLRHADHVIVVFRREGALWIRRSPGSAESSEFSERTLIFDPSLAEGQWKTTLKDEEARIFGHMSVFTAAIALELAKGSGPGFQPDIVAAMRRGLIASRELYVRGHGPVKKGVKSEFPFPAIGDILRGDLPERPRHALDRFAEKPLPATLTDPDWTIASLNDPEPEPLYALGFQTAIYGPERLSGIPHARFGQLLTVDRKEIETLRTLRQLILNYEKGGPQKQPLCIGAFGPPGSGKSFGIKQIAIEILGKDVPILEFNLSQFSDSRDLIGAFHQVRDKVLSGHTPVVFWDEFDSENLRWLQFLLAPMQDGKFQSGQLTHTLGKCVFVFAGATSWDFENFGPGPKPTEKVGPQEDPPHSDALELWRRADLDFRQKKGPDFVSRLSGRINVLGPNRRLTYNKTTRVWDVPDRTDITFPVRRALLLRSFVKAKENKRLESMDRDLLNALIRQPSYRYGARSMQKVVEPLRDSHTPLRPAQLPPPEVLDQVLDPSAEFLQLLSENTAFLTPANLRELAAAIHENYRRLSEPQYVYDPQFRDTYDKLNAWGKATNLAAASGIPSVLAMAGLCVTRGVATRKESAAATERLRRYLDPLRREEHYRWMSYVLANGWLQTTDKDPVTHKPLRDNARRLHNCLLPFDDLDPADQKKDDQAILSLPETVALVDFKIALFDDKTLPARP